jgi:hypothetical protein
MTVLISASIAEDYVRLAVIPFSMTRLHLSIPLKVKLPKRYGQ